MQIPVYNDAIARFGKDNKWIGFLDADEFIVLHKNQNISTFLKDFEYESAIGINWIMYDSNGFEDMPQDGFVISNFTRIHINDCNSSKFKFQILCSATSS